ncbi:hypothetical protein ACSSV8_000548 [Roseovarius sp. MBR-79]|jgi:hypothetical protein
MSDILKNPVAVGVGGGVVGLLLGSLLSLSAIDSKVRTGVERAMGPVTEAAQGDKDVLAGLSDRLAALETAVTGTAGDAVAVTEEAMAAFGARLGALEGRIEGVAADLGARISETASEQVAALRGALDARPAPEPAPAPEVAAAPSHAANIEGLSDAGAARGVGQTFVLAGGAVRAFVQRLDAGAGAARLSVNGATSDLSVGETLVVSHAGGACRLGLAGVGADGVRLVSDCDNAGGGDALGTAYSPGEMAILGDGLLRVFVSGAIGDRARLAINGLETELVGVGERRSVTIVGRGCSLSVTGIRGTSVLLDGGCS